MTEASSTCVNVQVDTKKLIEYIESFRPALEHGEITFDELEEVVKKNAGKFAEIVPNEYPEGTIFSDPKDESIKYKVYKNGEEKEGNWQECHDWLYKEA